MFSRTRTFALALAAAAGLSQLMYAQSEPLTNHDVVRMVQAQLSTSVILAALESVNVSFNLSPEGLIALKAAGVDDRTIETMQEKTRARNTGSTTDAVSRNAPEKSGLLATSRDPEVIRRTFKTVVVNASKAVYFDTPQMKAALGADRGWPALNLVIVDDAVVADAVLEVGHTFAWDFPYSLKHQNTSMVLVSGTGYGPFSGPLGAVSVAAELVKQLKRYRAVAPQGQS